jgi:dTDP-4-amino-4,6-dideoxygalactose transaminase
MKVPLLDVTRQNAPLAGELKDAFARVLDSGRFILGEEVERFEEEAAAAAGARYAVGVASGTDAILVSLMALGVGPGDEVICPSFTFFATAGCVARVGARPVFADSCPVCCNLDPARLEALFTPRTKAVIPVHLFGQLAEMPPILEEARRRGVAVIEDAAQSFGAGYAGRGPAVYGDCMTVSFFPSKNLGALGDGGLVATDDAALAARIRVLRNHGAHPKYYHSMVGGNFRLDALQAALLRVKLPHLAAYHEGRKRNAAAYTEALARCANVREHPAGAACGGEIDRAPGIVLPAAHAGRDHIRNQYTLRVIGEGGPGRRDALRARLAERGVGCEVYYPAPLHRQECFAASGPHAPLPVAERLADECLSLPIFAELFEAERDYVIETVAGFTSEL